MKPKLLTVISLMAILAVLVLAYWEKMTSMGRDMVVSDHSSIPNSTNGPRVRSDEQRLDRLDSDWRSYADYLIRVGESANKTINFYGQVVDEEGVGIQDVKVHLRVYLFSKRDALENGAMQSRDEFHIKTDGRGMFKLEGATGYSVEIRGVEKEGYRLLPRQRIHFSYDDTVDNVHSPDISDPVVFAMWRNRGAEGAIRYNRRGKIPYDGTEVHFDLEKGRLGAGRADLRISLLRDPLNVEWGGAPFDWILRLEVPEGGIVPTTGIPTWEAPEDGYERSHDLVMLADSPGWKEKDEVTFFVKARGGDLYGWLRVTVHAGYDQAKTGIVFEVHVNPKGSRILEPK